MTEGQIRLNNIDRTLVPKAIIWMRIEWALESDENCMTIISMSRKWNLFSTYGKVWPGNTYFRGGYQSACRTEKRPEPTQVVKPLELL